MQKHLTYADERASERVRAREPITNGDQSGDSSCEMEHCQENKLNLFYSSQATKGRKYHTRTFHPNRKKLEQIPTSSVPYQTSGVCRPLPEHTLLRILQVTFFSSETMAIHHGIVGPKGLDAAML